MHKCLKTFSYTWDCMLVKHEGLWEPVMCIIDPIIAAVPDAEIVENITVNTRDIKFYRVCCQWWFYHDTPASNDRDNFAHKPFRISTQFGFRTWNKSSYTRMQIMMKLPNKSDKAKISILPVWILLGLITRLNYCYVTANWTIF